MLTDYVNMEHMTNAIMHSEVGDEKVGNIRSPFLRLTSTTAQWSKRRKKVKNTKYMKEICAQWSKGVTKPPWSSEQIEVNMTFLETFWNILRRKHESN